MHKAKSEGMIAQTHMVDIHKVKWSRELSEKTK